MIMADGGTQERQTDNVIPPDRTPRLLLHCCCAPCASYVLEHLAPRYEITILFYNPNISPREEYERRAAEFNKLAALPGKALFADMVVAGYDHDVFAAVSAPFRDEPEGGRRCRACIELRLKETAARAREGGFDCFTTTLSVSPHKNAGLINSIGAVLASESGVEFLSADFKKHDGYKRSVELSRQYGLYRQSYCGCGIPEGKSVWQQVR